MDRNFRHQGDFWETLCYALIPPYELYSHIDWLDSCNLASISPLHNETMQLLFTYSVIASNKYNEMPGQSSSVNSVLTYSTYSLRTRPIGQ